MKPWVNRSISIIQILFMVGSIVFIAMAYEHHSGNDRYLNFYQARVETKEINFLKRRLSNNFPKIDEFKSLESPDSNAYHLFEAKQPDQDPISIVRIRKELTCEDCRTLDYLVVINREFVIQLVKLIDPILITGKPINPNTFLEQFKNKSELEGIEPIEAAPESSEAITQGVSEAISLIKALS